MESDVGGLLKAADECAGYALRFLPVPPEGEGRPEPDPVAAAAWGQLAVYFQQRAGFFQQVTLARRLPYVEEALLREAHATASVRDELEHQGKGLRLSLEGIERAVHRVADERPRLFGERVAEWWERFKRRRMPAGPPPYRIAWWREMTPAWPSTSMSQVDGMAGDEFERFVAGLLERAGWEVEVVGSGPANNPGQGDHEVDLIAVRGEVRLAVQCKRFAPTGRISSEAMRSFVGGVHTWYPDAGALMYVTSTDRVSPAARETARKAQVVLVTRTDLELWCRDGSVPAGLAALVPAEDAGEQEAQEQAEPVPPAGESHKPVMIFTMVWMVLALVALSVVPLVAPAEKSAFGVAVLWCLVVPLAAVWAWAHWRRYWWRRGINELWRERGWYAYHGSPVAYRVPSYSGDAPSS